jgi:hypothetical protein
MKTCKKCGLTKKITEFGKDKHKADGINFYCKICIKLRSAAQKQANPEYYKNFATKYREENREKLREIAKFTYWRDHDKRREQGKKSYNKHKDEIAKRRKIKRSTPEARKYNRERIKNWRQKNPDKFRKSVKKWQQTHKIKHNAHQMVHRAIENGILKRSETCLECGKIGKTEGHHEDYNKPLEVVWLCRLCHAKKIETVEV